MAFFFFILLFVLVSSQQIHSDLEQDIQYLNKAYFPLISEQQLNDIIKNTDLIESVIPHSKYKNGKIQVPVFMLSLIIHPLLDLDLSQINEFNHIKQQDKISLSIQLQQLFKGFEEIQEFLWAAYQAQDHSQQLDSLEKAGLFSQNLLDVFQDYNSALFIYSDISMPYIIVFSQLHACINQMIVILDSDKQQQKMQSMMLNKEIFLRYQQQCLSLITDHTFQIHHSCSDSPQEQQECQIMHKHNQLKVKCGNKNNCKQILIDLNKNLEYNINEVLNKISRKLKIKQYQTK